MRWILPIRLRRTLRMLHRRQVLRRALAVLPALGEATSASLVASTLAALVYGWGNETFSARHEFLAAVVSYGRRAAGPILECGSGLSRRPEGSAMPDSSGNMLTSLTSASEGASTHKWTRRELTHCGCPASDLNS
jgi:hypothetical protein